MKIEILLFKNRKLHNSLCSFFYLFPPRLICPVVALLHMWSNFLQNRFFSIGCHGDTPVNEVIQRCDSEDPDVNHEFTY